MPRSTAHDMMRTRNLTDPFPTFVPFSRRSEESTACGPVREIVSKGKVKDRKRYKAIKPPEPLMRKEPPALPDGKGANSPRLASSKPSNRRPMVGVSVFQRWPKYQENR